jgi:Mrp family chromosome partitioning ATPase
MTTTNEAFIRAYGRAHDRRDGQNLRDRQAIAGGPYEPASAESHWHTSVRIVGVDTDVTQTEATVSARPSQPIFPSSIRYQQQYYRLDQPLPDVGMRGTEEWLGPTGPHSATVPPTASESFCGSPNRGYYSSFLPAPQEPKSSLTAFQYPDICRQLQERVGPAYDIVADAIGTMIHEGRSMIGVAGTQWSVGCTTTVLMLGQRLLSRGCSVVIVDANFSRPGLGRSLGIPVATTWQDVLLHGAPLDGALVRSVPDGLVVLPAAQSVGLTVPAAQLSMTAGALRYRFDVALIDLGAVLDPHQGAISHSVAQAMRVDGVLLVSDAERNREQDRRQVEQFFLNSRCPTIGTIENFAPGGG